MKQSIFLFFFLPPLSFFVTVFTQSSHDFLLQIRNREAFKGRVTTRRLGRSKKLNSFLGKLLWGPIGAAGILAGDLETGNIILKHIGDIFKPAKTEQSSSFKLEGLFELRRKSQSRIDEVQSGGNLSVFLSGNEGSSILDVFFNNLKKGYWRKSKPHLRKMKKMKKRGWSIYLSVGEPPVFLVNGRGGLGIDSHCWWWRSWRRRIRNPS